MALKIIFMGTPEFSVPILKSIHNSKHNVIEVYTQSPKKKNRGQLINLTPIHEFSNKNNINVTLIGKIISEKGIHFDSHLDVKNIKKFDHFS